MISCPKCKCSDQLNPDSSGWSTCPSCGHLWNALAQITEVKSHLQSDEYLPDKPNTKKTQALTSRAKSDTSSGVLVDNLQVVLNQDALPSDLSILSGNDFTKDKPAVEAEIPDIEIPIPEMQSIPHDEIPVPEMQEIPENAVPSSDIDCPTCGYVILGTSIKSEEMEPVCPSCKTPFNKKTKKIAKSFLESYSEEEVEEDSYVGKEIGGCIISSKLGAGGMGSVYKAVQISLDRTVALKVLPKELTTKQSFIRRFIQEAKSLAKINFPNIVHIYDFGEDTKSKVYYIIMEFIDGTDMADMLHDRGRISQIETINIMLQAAQGLRAAASKGIIHRDVKPENIMIGSDNVFKVSDFGLAKDAGTVTQTNAKIRVGTPAFMSPEQCDGLQLDFRTDVYSLGCTGFVALTGVLPYDAESPFSIMLKHKVDEIPRVKSKFKDIIPAFDRLIYTMMEKEPSDRPKSWESIIDELQEIHQELSGNTEPFRNSEFPLALVPETLLEEQTKQFNALQDGSRSKLSVVNDSEVVQKSSIPDLAVLEEPVKLKTSEIIEKSVNLIADKGSSSSRLKVDLPQLSETRPHKESGISSRIIIPKEVIEERKKKKTEKLRNMSTKRLSAIKKGDSEFSVSTRDANEFYKLGDYKKALDIFERVAPNIKDLKHREATYDKIQDIRTILSKKRYKRLFLGTLFLIAVTLIAAKIYFPIVHDMYASHDFKNINKEQKDSLQKFINKHKKYADLFVEYCGDKYTISSLDKASFYLACINNIEEKEQQKTLISEKTKKVKEDYASNMSWEELLIKVNLLIPEIDSEKDSLELKQIKKECTEALDKNQKYYQSIMELLEKGKISTALENAKELRKDIRAGSLLLSLPIAVELFVSNQQGEKLTDYKLQINGIDVPKGMVYSISGKEIPIAISKEGYSFSEVFVKNTDVLNIILQPQLRWSSSMPLNKLAWLKTSVYNNQMILFGDKSISSIDLNTGKTKNTNIPSTKVKLWHNYNHQNNKSILLYGVKGGVYDWDIEKNKLKNIYSSNETVKYAVKYRMEFYGADAISILSEDLDKSVKIITKSDKKNWEKTIGKSVPNKAKNPPAVFYKKEKIFVFNGLSIYTFDEDGTDRGKKEFYSDFRDVIEQPESFFVRTKSEIEKIIITDNGVTNKTVAVLEEEPILPIQVIEEKIAVVFNDKFTLFTLSKSDNNELWSVDVPSVKSFAMNKKYIALELEKEIWIISSETGQKKKVITLDAPLLFPLSITDSALITISSQSNKKSMLFRAYTFPNKQ